MILQGHNRAQGRAASKLEQAVQSNRDNRVFVDFDHTLFLANSTEAFLASARPATLAALVLKLLALLSVIPVKLLRTVASEHSLVFLQCLLREVLELSG